MSDQIESQNVTPTDEAKPKAKRTRKDVPFSSCHVKFAQAKGIDVTRAAKLNRSFIRSNFDTLVKHWPALKASHKINRDNNRYPETIPVKVADAIVKRNLSTLKSR